MSSSDLELEESMNRGAAITKAKARGYEFYPYTDERGYLVDVFYRLGAREAGWPDSKRERLVSVKSDTSHEAWDQTLRWCEEHWTRAHKVATLDELIERLGT